MELPNDLTARMALAWDSAAMLATLREINAAFPFTLHRNTRQTQALMAARDLVASLAWIELAE